MTGLYELARWVRSFRPDGIPPDVLHRASLLVLDSLTCALAARNDETVRGVLEILADQGGSEQSRIIGTALRVPSSQAVFGNGVLIRALDFNDFMGLGKLGGHPSDNLSVALSIAGWKRSSGPEVLAAVVMAYELYGRIQELIDREQPWDHVSASGFVAPAIAGHLMGLGEQELANAIAMSAAHCATLAAIRTGHISSSKMLANALVAQTGTLAALLAAKGLTGPLHILADHRGFGSSLPGNALADVFSPCSQHFRILDVAVKVYPCIGTSQAAIAAALALRQRWLGGLPDIDRVTVIMADTRSIRAQAKDPERRHPRSREAADHSFYFLIAVALLDGTLETRQFDQARWFDPAVMHLMERIEIRTEKHWNNRAPDAFPCTIRVMTQSGDEHVSEVAYPPGHPRTLSDDVVVEKFNRCTRPLLGSHRACAIASSALALKESGSVSDLLEQTVIEVPSMVAE